MNMMFRYRGVALFCLIVAAAFAQPFGAQAALEETFDMLQIGTHTYRNVTVTTKSKAYVFILHSGGMTNLKVADLPADVLKTLGYADPTVPKVPTNGASAWAKQTLAKLEVPQLTSVKAELKNQWMRSPAAAKLPFPLPEITMRLLLTVAAVLLVIYLFYCFCCMLICKKAGHEPGVLVWVPLLQIFPMLRAAEMSPWWFLGFLVPGLNIVGQVIWFFKIAQTRGKSPWVGVFLLIPVTSLFAFLYLAFSSCPSGDRDNGGRIELMTLETA